ncbi:efflux RND transporter periplasmic adaptor subunit, partial [Phyllobacterium sp. 22229]
MVSKSRVLISVLVIAALGTGAYVTRDRWWTNGLGISAQNALAHGGKPVRDCDGCAVSGKRSKGSG